VGRADDREGHTGDSFGENDVALFGPDARLLVVVVRAALIRRDEARAELRAGVTHPQSLNEAGLVADAAGADDRHPEAGELVVERARAARARVATGAV